MRQITEVLRLNAQELSYRQIAQSVGISASTVQSYLERAQRAGLSWPLPNDVDDAALEARLFTRTEEELRPGRPEPNWLGVDRERKRGKQPRPALWRLGLNERLERVERARRLRRGARQRAQRLGISVARAWPPETSPKNPMIDQDCTLFRW